MTLREWTQKLRPWMLGGLILAIPMNALACGGSTTTPSTIGTNVSPPTTVLDPGSATLSREALAAILECGSASSKIRDLHTQPASTYLAILDICENAYKQLTIDINLGPESSSAKAFRFELQKWLTALSKAPSFSRTYEQMTPDEFSKILNRFID